MAAAIRNVVGVGADFGRAIGSAAAKFPDQIQRGTKEFLALKVAARDVGATTEFTAIQGAKALNFLAKAGFKAQEAIGALPAIVDFATASEIDLATAADIATDALGAFGLDSTDLTTKMTNMRRVMDVMAKAANASNQSVQELFNSVRDGAPVATQAGVTLGTYTATMALLASNGIKAAKAGTAAKNTTLALAGVGNQAAKVFKRLRIELFDKKSGKLRDQVDVLDDLRKALTGFKGNKLALLEGIFGRESLSAAAILLADSTGKVRELRKTLESAGGSSKKLAMFIRDDVRGSLDGLNSAIEDVKIGIFDMNEGPLKDAIDGWTTWTRVNGKFISAKLGEALLYILNNLDSIVLTIRQVAGVLVTLWAFSLAVKAISAAFVVAKVAMAAFAFITAGIPAVIAGLTAAWWLLNAAMMISPIGLIVLAVTALIGLAALVIAAWDPVTEFFGEMYDKVAGFLAPAASLFGFGDGSPGEDGTDGTAANGVISPQDRTATNIERSMTSSTAQLNIAGAPEGSTLTTNTPTPGIKLKLANSGGF
jgi:TP901 family phage tail tape measure protein